MEKPLGKRKLYERVKEALDCEIPRCKDLLYSEYRGSEWLENRDFMLTSNAGGDWVGIHHFVKDEHGEERMRYDIFSSYEEGKYCRHYQNGELV